MSVTKKPTPPKSVDEFIQNAQATVLNATPTKAAAVQPVQLRVLEDLLVQIGWLPSASLLQVDTSGY